MAQPLSHPSLGDFLEWENAQDTRNERQNFELIDQTGQAELVLDSVGMRLAMAEVFDGVEEPAGTGSG